jgi:hypothetical protein
MITLKNALERVEEFRLHPLGFFYLASEGTEGIRYRFHLWLEHMNEPGGINQFHTHSFDLESTALNGKLRNEIFTFSTQSDIHPSPEPDIQEFEVKYEDNESVLFSTGKNGYLQQICAFELSKGCSYFLAAGTIHRAVVVERPCITQVRTVERQGSILSYGSFLTEQSFSRRRANRPEIELLERTLRACGAASI